MSFHWDPAKHNSTENVEMQVNECLILKDPFKVHIQCVNHDIMIQHDDRVHPRSLAPRNTKIGRFIMVILRSMWVFYFSIQPVIGVERMYCETFVKNNFHSVS